MTTTKACKVLVAYGEKALTESPTYVELDPVQMNGFTSYRGRQYLTDRTNAGTATIPFNDKTGLLDPTNVASAIYPPGPVPMSPAQIQLLNPFTGNYLPVFSGLTQDVPQTVQYQGSRMNQGVLDLVDMFGLLAIKEVPPGLDFDSSGSGTSTANNSGDTTYSAQSVQDRLLAIAADVGIPSGLVSFNTGNVFLQKTVYSPGSFALAAMQDAADAEFPGVSNLYVSGPNQGLVPSGTLMFKGRLARFDPTTYGATIWKLADKAGGAPLSPSYATIYYDNFVIDMDVVKIVNNALFTPENILNADIAGQLIEHVASRDFYGPRPITGLDLIVAGQTAGALSPGSYSNALAVCQMFGQWYVNGFNAWNDGDDVPAPPVNIKQVTLRPVRLTAPNAEYHWNMICNVEIGDVVEITCSTPNGGGFTGSSPESQFFVEGIRYVLVPGGPIPDVSVTLDLSPRAPYLVTPPDNWNPGA